MPVPHSRNPQQGLAALRALVAGRSVLFVTPSHPRYIRNRQELELLRSAARDVTVVAPRDAGGIVPTGIVRLAFVGVKFLASLWRRYDLVFVGGVPQAYVPFLRPLLRRQPLVVDFFVSLYDTLALDRRRLRSTGFVARLLKSLDTVTLRTADHVVVDTRAHGDYFARELGLDASKLMVLYLEADHSTYAPRVVPKAADLRDKFVVFFFGAMNPLQGMEVIFEAAKALYARVGEEVMLLLVGPLSKVRGGPEIATLPNVRHLGEWLDEPSIARHIASADVCLAGHFSGTIPKARRVIPGKAYIYRSMGKPMVLGDNAANRELFSERDSGVWFSPHGDGAALADVIERVREHAHGRA